MAEMQIQIGAEVNGAIRGLQQVESQAQRTFQKVSSTSAQAGTAVGNLSRIVQDAPFGFIAISNNLQPLFDDFTRLKGQTGSLGGAFKALAGSIAGPAGIGLAFAAATSLITVFSKELFGSSKASEKAKTEADKLKDSINGIFSQTAKEASSTAGLVAVLRSETESRERKLSAIKQLQQIQPEIFAGLKLEGQAVVGLDTAYQNYIANLQNVVTAKIKQAQLEQLIEALLKKQGVTLVGVEKQLFEGARQMQNARQNQINGEEDYMGVRARMNKQFLKETQKEQSEIKRLQIEIQRLTNDLSELSTGIKLPDLPAPKVKNIEFDEINAIQIGLKPFEDALKNITQNRAFNLGKLRATLSGILFEPTPTFFEQLQSQTSERIAKAFPEAFKLRPPVEIDPQTLSFGKEFVKGINEIEQAIAGLQTDALSGFVSSIAEAVGGGNIRNVFQSFVDSISSGIVAIGKQMIALGLKAALLKKSLATLFTNPTALIAAGFGLVAVGSAIRGALSKGIEGREKGGPVAGNTPYIVGERGPELFVPAVSGSIIPNNRLSSFNGRPAFAMSGGGRSIVRGNDILLSYARTQRSQSRVNG